MTRPEEFRQRYGPFAVVAGASEGLGAAFAEAAARRGLHLVLVARRSGPLEAHAAELRNRYSVDVRTLAADLAEPDYPNALARVIGDVEVGLGIYNAAYSFVGELLDRPLADALQVVDVNAKGPLRFVHALAPAMVTRGRGGLVLMSSLAGFQGSRFLSVYAATKGFNTVLAESLWAELGPKGVDVLASCAGAIRTPGYKQNLRKEAPGTQDPSAVADETLDALGHGAIVIPGAVNKAASFLLRRLLPRATAVRILGRSVAGLD